MRTYQLSTRFGISTSASHSVLQEDNLHAIVDEDMGQNVPWLETHAIESLYLY